MKYKIIDREDYTEDLDFHFFIDKCEDESGNIVYHSHLRRDIY